MFWSYLPKQDYDITNVALLRMEIHLLIESVLKQLFFHQYIG
jgi:hypothetical protein